MNQTFVKSKKQFANRASYHSKSKVSKGNGILSGHRMWLYFVPEFTCWVISFRLGSKAGVWAVWSRNSLSQENGGEWKVINSEAKFEKVNTELISLPCLQTKVTLPKIKRKDSRRKSKSPTPTTVDNSHFIAKRSTPIKRVVRRMSDFLITRNSPAPPLTASSTSTTGSSRSLQPKKVKKKSAKTIKAESTKAEKAKEKSSLKQKQTPATQSSISSTSFTKPGFRRVTTASTTSKHKNRLITLV